MHVTACDLEKSFSFDKTVEITSHVCFPIHVYSFIGLLVTSYDWCKQRFGQVRRPLPFTSNTLSCLICEQKHELNSVSTEHEVLHGVVVSACCRYNTISTIKSVITSPLFPPVSGVKYCDQRFCMTVCLSVRWYVSKTTYRYPNFTKLSVLVSCYFGPWLGPPHDGNAICSICYVFPVLWMTSCFHMMKQLDQNQAWRYLSSSSPGGGTGDEVCRLRLLLVWYCIKSGPVRQNTIIRDSFLI